MTLLAACQAAPGTDRCDRTHDRVRAAADGSARDRAHGTDDYCRGAERGAGGQPEARRHPQGYAGRRSVVS